MTDWWLRMAKLNRPDRIESIISFKWLKEQFDQIHKDDWLILKRIDDLEKLLVGDPNAPVIPELAKQVRLVSAIATKIDLKVPDKCSPSDSKQPIKKG